MRPTQDKRPSNNSKVLVKRNKKGQLLPGSVLNPKGNEPGTAFSLLTILKNELQKCPEGQDKKTYADLIIKRMLKEAIEKGDIQQIKLIWNYIEGMPRQPIDFEGVIKTEELKPEQIDALLRRRQKNNAGGKELSP